MNKLFKYFITTCIFAIFLSASTSTFAMSNSDFDNGISKGISYFNRGLYYEAKDEFQWFADYNWGKLNDGQQKYLLDYLGAAKQKVRQWESKLADILEKAEARVYGIAYAKAYYETYDQYTEMFPPEVIDKGNRYYLIDVDVIYRFKKDNGFVEGHGERFKVDIFNGDIEYLGGWQNYDPNWYDLD